VKATSCRARGHTIGLQSASKTSEHQSISKNAMQSLAYHFLSHLSPRKVCWHPLSSRAGPGVWFCSSTQSSVIVHDDERDVNHVDYIVLYDRLALFGTLGTGLRGSTLRETGGKARC